VSSLCEHGQQQPVLVVRAGSGDGIERYVLIDGYARVAALAELAWLLRELIEGHAIAQRDLGAMVGRSASWVSRRLGLIEALPEVVEQALRAGRLPA